MKFTAVRHSSVGAGKEKRVTVHGGKTAFLCHCEAFRPKQSQMWLDHPGQGYLQITGRMPVIRYGQNSAY